jgi:predicted GNAT family acetyltransferase
VRNPGFHVLRHHDAESFLACAEPWLSNAEPETNLVLGLAYWLRGELAVGRPRPWLLTIHRDDAIVGCALRTPPRELILTQMERPGVLALVCSLPTELPALPGVIGPEPSAGTFAAEWSSLHRQPSQPRMHQRFYALRKLRPGLPATPGHLRLASSSDLPQVAEWMAHFAEEAATRDSDRPEEIAERTVGRGQVFLWEDSRPLSMAGWTGATSRGRRLGYVFTPPLERRRGYASACVAALSRTILSMGDHYCCLYADLANATSNAIYVRIGYEPLYDAAQYSFAGSPSHREV